MKKFSRIILLFVATIGVFYAFLALSFKDPKPSCYHKDLPIEAIAIHELEAVNDKAGVFKSEVELEYSRWNREEKNFSGLQIDIEENSRVDQIFIGQTNNRNCRIELWNKGQLLSFDELGFAASTEWNEPFKLSMEFFDQNNEFKPKTASIRFKVFQGSDFTGDAGNLDFDLSPFGNFKGKKYVSSFSVNLSNRQPTEEVSFSDLVIWKNHQNAD